MHLLSSFFLTISTAVLFAQNINISHRSTFTYTGIWEIEGFIPGKGDTDMPGAYEFRVPDLLPGTHFFRLRQIDTDGTSSFTDVRSLVIRGKSLQVSFRPNTVSESGEMYFFTETPTSVQVEIFNAAGIPVGLSWDFDLEQETILPVETSQLPGGIYFAVVQTEQERVVAQFLKL